jgi:hypothetical protein
MNTHACLECCQTLSYLDGTLRMDMDAIRDVPGSWKWRHPLKWRDAKGRAAYAAEIAWESGK